MMMTSRWSSKRPLLGLVLGVCACFSLVMLSAGPAAAKAPPAFKQHVDKALKAYEQGEYEDAVKEFQAAYALRQLPKLLLNIAQSHRKLGRAKEALDFYEFYLRVEPNPKPELKTELEAYIKQTRAMLAAAEGMKKKRDAEDAAAQEEARRIVGGPDPAQAEKDQAEKDRAEKDRAEKDRLAKEEQAAKDKAEAERKQQAVAAAALSQEQGALQLRAQPVKQPIYKKWWLWTGVGVVVAGVVVGVVLGTTLGGKAAPADPMLPGGLDVRDQRF